MKAKKEVFSGEWTIECVSSGSWYKTFTIEGSASSDRVYELGPAPADVAAAVTGNVPGVQSGLPPITVSGSRWALWFEWPLAYEPDTSLHRANATYTLADGLQVDLACDNRSIVGADPAARRVDGLSGVATDAGPTLYDSVILRCRNIDPKLNPWRPFVPSYDFAIPPAARRVRDPFGRRVPPVR
jgi:hypothetical protein